MAIALDYKDDKGFEYKTIRRPEPFNDKDESLKGKRLSLNRDPKERFTAVRGRYSNGVVTQ